jgi:hypothetical protein
MSGDGDEQRRPPASEAPSELSSEAAANGAGTVERTRRLRRSTLVTSAVVIAGVTIWCGVALWADVSRGGLHPCDRLDESLCRDLGPADCAFWKARLGRRGAASTEPHHLRRNKTALLDVVQHKLLGWDMAKADNPLCYDELHNDLYPTILGTVRVQVAARRAADRAAASSR